jgi:hypothetical protein
MPRRVKAKVVQALELCLFPLELGLGLGLVRTRVRVRVKVTWGKEFKRTKCA